MGKLLIFLLKKKKVSCSQIEAWGNCRTSSIRDYIPNAQGWLEPALPQQASHVLNGHCSQIRATSFASGELCWLVPGQDPTFHQASGVAFYGQQHSETRWDRAEGEQTLLKSQKRVMLPIDTKKAPKPPCMSKAPVEIPWSTRIAVKFCQTLHEHFTTLWNNCLNSKLQLFH